MPLQPATLRLFSIANSAARARIQNAARLKNIPITYHTIDFPVTAGRTEPEVEGMRDILRTSIAKASWLDA